MPERKPVDTVVDVKTHERSLNLTSLVTVVVILATVTMTFGAMIAVFFYRSLDEKYWGHVQLPALLWITTALLIVSSGTFEQANRVLKNNDQAGFHQWMRWTFGLALTFLVGQILAGWQLLHQGLVLSKNPHSWFIYLFSGLHGIHIIGGLMGIAYLLWRTREPAGGPKFQVQTRVTARGVAVCWHYLDFLWLVLFALLLTWKR